MIEGAPFAFEEEPRQEKGSVQAPDLDVEFNSVVAGEFPESTSPMGGIEEELAVFGLEYMIEAPRGEGGDEEKPPRETHIHFSSILTGSGNPDTWTHHDT